MENNLVANIYKTYVKTALRGTKFCIAFRAVNIEHVRQLVDSFRCSQPTADQSAYPYNIQTNITL